VLWRGEAQAGIDRRPARDVENELDVGIEALKAAPSALLPRGARRIDVRNVTRAGSPGREADRREEKAW
jgi:hypothetical protein